MKKNAGSVVFFNDNFNVAGKKQGALRLSVEPEKKAEADSLPRGFPPVTSDGWHLYQRCW
jgi:hypothetical protein